MKSPADVEKPINITLNADGTVTGDIEATWTMTNGTPYMSFTWGGVTYKGAFIVQNDEAADSRQENDIHSNWN